MERAWCCSRKIWLFSYSLQALLLQIHKRVIYVQEKIGRGTKDISSINMAEAIFFKKYYWSFSFWVRCKRGYQLKDKSGAIFIMGSHSSFMFHPEMGICSQGLHESDKSCSTSCELTLEMIKKVFDFCFPKLLTPRRFKNLSWGFKVLQKLFPSVDAVISFSKEEVLWKVMCIFF